MNTILPGPKKRKAAATVEFAFIAPVFALIAMGVCEISNMLDKKTDLMVIVREGARTALFDRDGFLETGASTNEKVIDDVRNLLHANALPGDAAIITITYPGTSIPFNLDDPDNDWELFELRIRIPYTGLTSWYNKIGGPSTLDAFIVFLNGQSRPPAE